MGSSRPAVFTQRNFVAGFFRQKLNFISKTAKSRFVPPFGGLRSNVHGLFYICGKRVVDLLLVLGPLIEHFSSVAFVSVILGLAVLVQYRGMTEGRTDRQTDRRTDEHTMTARTALA